MTREIQDCAGDDINVRGVELQYQAWHDLIDGFFESNRFPVPQNTTVPRVNLHPGVLKARISGECNGEVTSILCLIIRCWLLTLLLNMKPEMCNRVSDIAKTTN